MLFMPLSVLPPPHSSGRGHTLSKHGRGSRAFRLVIASIAVAVGALYAVGGVFLNHAIRQHPPDTMLLKSGD